MSLPRYSSSPYSSTDHGYTLYTCDCCPYGYHIDLDFVRYCESINQETQRSGSVKRRKDRRRQRQSMEVLLGIIPPVINTVENNYKPIEENIVEAVFGDHLLRKQDSFDNAVSDFEKTLQRSKNKSKLSNNLPDVTGVSDNIGRTEVMATSTIKKSPLAPPIPVEVTPQKEFTNDVSGLTPTAFKNIREQMALSLDRTRKLEDQIKMLPELQLQIVKLKDENKRLIYKVKSYESEKNYQLNSINANYLNCTTYPRLKSQSFSEIDTLDNGFRSSPPPPPPRKDFGVNCGVLTRNVGVGHQAPFTKNVSTTTPSSNDYADKWYSEKIKFINDLCTEKINPRKITLNKFIQTTFDVEKFNSYTQTTPLVSLTFNQHTQTADKVVYYDKSVEAAPRNSSVGVQKEVEVYNVGVSDDTISDINCERCSGLGLRDGIGSTLIPISLASLSSFPRSKSFNLGEERLSMNIKNRTVACQYEANNVSKSCQYEPIAGVTKSCQSEVAKTYSKACQHELKLVEKNTQYEKIHSVSRNTDTKDLIIRNLVEVACEAKETKSPTKDVGCNTPQIVEEKVTCEKCDNKDKEDMKKEPPISPSRIPRPSHIPTFTNFENRKFKRQDTYTKICSSPPEKFSTMGLSGLDLSPKVSIEDTSFEKVKDDLTISEVCTSSTVENGITIPGSKVQESLPISKNIYTQLSNQRHRKKAVPSKEMKGAMKVLNDCLVKNTNPKNSNAVDIVQQEWFKISSLITANPLDVEDYLDIFEDISSLLLGYIVNMTDASGNTAMHYAVSHGNFDVVSILLDSKVCDINKTNKAGYTSVMLVSLAEIRSKTHANVVRRLFQMSDVNIRAKQHGQTALMLAVSHGRLDMVKMLLEAGADINIQDDDGSTALMCAAEHGHIEIVKHFLSHPDCDSSITDVDGSTALKIAMEAGHRPIGVLLYAHERNLCTPHKHKKKSSSPKPPSSPLSIRSSQRALSDIKPTK